MSNSTILCNLKKELFDRDQIWISNRSVQFHEYWGVSEECKVWKGT